jgi:predicted nucleic acid-binding protein
VSEAPVVNSSPLIYLAHSGLIPLLEIAGCIAIIDDRAGRRCAELLGIPVLGTLGIVLRAKRLGQVDSARPLIRKLQEAGMYLSDRVLEPALKLVGE